MLFVIKFDDGNYALPGYDYIDRPFLVSSHINKAQLFQTWSKADASDAAFVGGKIVPVEIKETSS